MNRESNSMQSGAQVQKQTTEHVVDLIHLMNVWSLIRINL